MFTSAVVSIVLRNTIFRKAPPSVVSGYGKRSINLNRVTCVSAELQRSPIRHNGAKKKLQLKHKNSLFTLQTFHYNYYWWSQSLLNRFGVYRVHLAWAIFELTTLVVICIDSIGNYKSNYHTITTTTVPWKSENVEIITLYMYITLLILLNLYCLAGQWLSPGTPVSSCNNVAPVINLCLGRATTRSHLSQWSKKKVAVET
jgi:hypothetical protein